MTKTKRTVLIGILVSQALVLHVLERMIPVPVPVPGVKLGLANAISLLTIMLLGFKEAVLVVVLRTFLGSAFGGGLSAFLYSIAGGLISTMVMAVMYKKYRSIFSIPAISIMGAIFHNIAQITVASMVVSNVKLYYYLPILLISAVITGLFIGMVVRYTEKPLSSILRLGSDHFVDK